MQQTAGEVYSGDSCLLLFIPSSLFSLAGSLEGGAAAAFGVREKPAHTQTQDKQPRTRPQGNLGLPIHLYPQTHVFGQWEEAGDTGKTCKRRTGSPLLPAKRQCCHVTTSTNAFANGKLCYAHTFIHPLYKPERPNTYGGLSHLSARLTCASRLRRTQLHPLKHTRLLRNALHREKRALAKQIPSANKSELALGIHHLLSRSHV